MGLFCCVCTVFKGVNYSKIYIPSITYTRAKLCHNLWQLSAILLPIYGRRLAAVTRITFAASSRENSFSLSLSLTQNLFKIKFRSLRLFGEVSLVYLSRGVPQRGNIKLRTARSSNHFMGGRAHGVSPSNSCSCSSSGRCKYTSCCLPHVYATNSGNSFFSQPNGDLAKWVTRLTAFLGASKMSMCKQQQLAQRGCQEEAAAAAG